MSRINYTDQQIEDFLDLAQDIGIGRAIRELGYPTSWGTAQRWAKARGVEVSVDDLKARSKEYHDWYTTEEAMLVAQEGMKRVYEALVEQDLDADAQKKLAEAFQKHANTWLLLQGKANNINENRSNSDVDVEILRLIEEQKQLNEQTNAEIRNN